MQAIYHPDAGLRRPWIWLGSVLLISLAVLWPNMGHEWVNWDDQHYVLNNELVHELDAEHVKRNFTTMQVLGTYAPVTLLSFAADYDQAGPHGPVFHRTNVLIHLLNTALVFWLTLLLLRRADAAAVCAILFAIHPMHLEPVAWISARKDLLYGLFFLAGLISYLFAIRKPEKKILFMALTGLFFILSLLSKAVAVTFPLALLLIDHFEQREGWKKLILEKIPFLLLAAGFAILGYMAQLEAGAVTEIREVPLTESLFIASWGFLNYLIKSLIPFNLSAYHPNPAESGIPWYFYISLLPAAALLFAGYKWARKSRHVAFGLGFFLVTLLPVSQLIPVGVSVMADRFTYLPYIGLFFILARFFIRSFQLPQAKVIQGAFIIFIITMAGITRSRGDVWMNGETMWTDVIRTYPDHYFGWANRGSWRIDKGDLAGAEADLTTSIERNPQFAGAYNNRGLIYLNQGKYELAGADFSEAVGLDPAFFQPRVNLGLTYSKQGNFPLAIAAFNQAIELKPDNAETYYQRGLIYAQSNQPQAALEDFNQAIGLEGSNPLYFKERGKVLLFMGNPSAAIPDLKKAVELDPEFAEAHFILAIAFLESGKRSDASGAAKKAQELGFPVGAAFWDRLKE